MRIPKRQIQSTKQRQRQVGLDINRSSSCSFGISPMLHATPGLQPRTPHHTPHNSNKPSRSPQLLILRHALRRWSIPGRTTMRRRPLSPIRIHRHRSSLRLCPTTELLKFRLRPIFDVLPEIAHVAPDFLVWLEAEWDNGYEAECKPFPALHYATRGVAAVLAVELDVFGAFEGGCEGCGASLVLVVDVEVG